MGDLEVVCDVKDVFDRLICKKILNETPLAVDVRRWAFGVDTEVAQIRPDLVVGHLGLELAADRVDQPQLVDSSGHHRVRRTTRASERFIVAAPTSSGVDEGA